MPKPGRWAISDNKYDENGKNPKTLALSIPVESVHAFCNHLMNLADEQGKYKKAKVWNFDKNEAEEVDALILYFNGKDGQYGPWGHIKPCVEDSAGDAPGF